MRYCEDINITADAASRLFIYYGLASCVGRLVTGRLCDFEKVNTFYVYQVAELVVGAGTLLVTLATSYFHMVIFIVIYGLCDGAYITTLNLLLLTCVSPEKVPTALGWQMQVSSFFLASGPPIAGMFPRKGPSPQGLFQFQNGGAGVETPEIVLPKYSMIRGVLCHVTYDEIVLSEVIASDMQSCLFSGNLNPLFKRNEDILSGAFSLCKYHPEVSYQGKIDAYCFRRDDIVRYEERPESILVLQYSCLAYNQHCLQARI